MFIHTKIYPTVNLFRKKFKLLALSVKPGLAESDREILGTTLGNQLLTHNDLAL